CRSQSLAVRRERQREELYVPYHSEGDAGPLFSRGSVPQFELGRKLLLHYVYVWVVTETHRGQGLAVRGESYPGNPAGLCRQGPCPLLPGGHIPKDHPTGLLRSKQEPPRAHRQGFAVRREGEGLNRLVWLQFELLLAGVH